MITDDQLRHAALHCSLPAALEAMGERWSFLILRGAFKGLRHFEEFQTTLGIARNILANRLTRLVCHGILERRGCTDDRRKIEYRLTPKGEAATEIANENKLIVIKRGFIVVCCGNRLQFELHRFIPGELKR
jgi:DNA-binding HxlR family transcriptional regulator